MAIQDTHIRITRWQGGQHPSTSIITRLMKKEGLRPYMWNNNANHRYAVRSHNYDKILYVLDGSMEITLPDSNQHTTLRPGDRIDIPASIRHGIIVGKSGVQCAEASIVRR